MRDAMTPDSAVFEPEEVKILDAALCEATKRLGGALADQEDRKADLARLIHNLGRSRLQLKKALRSPHDAHSLAEEAAEVFSYMREAPAAFVEEGRRQGAVKQREMTIFPTALRQLPTKALPTH
jgi:hypothetical protein